MGSRAKCRIHNSDQAFVDWHVVGQWAASVQRRADWQKGAIETWALAVCETWVKSRLSMRQLEQGHSANSPA